MRIGITGSSGLIGSALCPVLESLGHEVAKMDIVSDDPSDVTVQQDIESSLRGCECIIHLAAVSRPVWAERVPFQCVSVNIGGTRNILRYALEHKACVLFASSREVYGQQDVLPVKHTAVLKPMNIYGWSKVEGERLVAEAQGSGLRAQVVRLSNVYGSVKDYANRVVPAFTAAAALGGVLTVEGLKNCCDFTYLFDVVSGTVKLVDMLNGSEPTTGPLHFVTGKSTTLRELAELCISIGGLGIIKEGTPRSYDVPRFFGDPEEVASILGWRASTPLSVGVSKMIASFRGMTT